MSGVYIHATNAVQAILKSGFFLGTNKQMQLTGADASRFSDSELHTLFVEWRKGSVPESVSRIAAAKGDIRGVLVFKDPQRKMKTFNNYPAVYGRKVPLRDLSLRAVVVAEEDMGNRLWDETLGKHAKKFVGSNAFAFDVEAISKVKNGKYIEDFLMSSQNGGVFR